MKKTLIATTVVVIAAVGLLLASKSSVAPTLGSVSYGSEYNATSTTAAGTQCLKVGSGTFGGIVVSSTTVGTFTVMNATSSTDAASTTIASFGASVSFGSYEYDSVFDRGLCVRANAGFNGVYTTMWR